MKLSATFEDGKTIIRFEPEDDFEKKLLGLLDERKLVTISPNYQMNYINQVASVDVILRPIDYADKET